MNRHLKGLFFAGIVSVLFLNVSPSVAEQDIVVLEQLKRHVTIPGDGLHRLSKRFGVSPESVLEANPKIAARTDPERNWWLYLYEEVVLPLFKETLKTPAEVSDADVVAVPMKTIRDKDSRIAESIAVATVAAEKLKVLQSEFEKLQKRFEKVSAELVASERSWRQLLGVCLLLVLFGVIISLYYWRLKDNFRDITVRLQETESRIRKLEGELADARSIKTVLQDLVNEISSIIKTAPRTQIVTPPSGPITARRAA